MSEGFERSGSSLGERVGAHRRPEASSGTTSQMSPPRTRERRRRARSRRSARGPETLSSSVKVKAIARKVARNNELFRLRGAIPRRGLSKALRLSLCEATLRARAASRSARDAQCHLSMLEQVDGVTTCAVGRAGKATRRSRKRRLPSLNSPDPVCVVRYRKASSEARQ